MNESGRLNDEALWALYNVDSDFSQANDLVAENPEKLRRLRDLWSRVAAKYSVAPLREVLVELKAK